MARMLTTQNRGHPRRRAPKARQVGAEAEAVQQRPAAPVNSGFQTQPSCDLFPAGRNSYLPFRGATVSFGNACKGAIVADRNHRAPQLAGSSRKRTIIRWLDIGYLMVSLAFSLHPTAGAEPTPLVAGRPVRLPLIEGKDIRFTHLSTEQGLSESRVDNMLQDRRGFIWIGTYNGLNRYDGYRFKTYKPDPNNPNSLGGLEVFALFEDRSGMLWIGIDQELDRFDPATETFTHFRAHPDNPD